MPIFILYLGLLIAVAFFIGMIAGSIRKEREYQDIIDTIFKRKYIVQEKNIDPKYINESEFEFMMMKDGKSLKPVFSKYPSNN